MRGICVCICIYMCISIYVCVSLYIEKWLCVDQQHIQKNSGFSKKWGGSEHTHTRMHAHMHTHTHTHTHSTSFTSPWNEKRGHKNEIEKKENRGRGEKKVSSKCSTTPPPPTYTHKHTHTLFVWEDHGFSSGETAVDERKGEQGREKKKSTLLALRGDPLSRWQSQWLCLSGLSPPPSCPASKNICVCNRTSEYERVMAHVLCINESCHMCCVCAGYVTCVCAWYMWYLSTRYGMRVVHQRVMGICAVHQRVTAHVMSIYES